MVPHCGFKFDALPCERKLVLLPSRDMYRRKALECVKTVERLRDPARRAALLQIAKSYLKLSRRAAATHDPGTPHQAAEPDAAERPHDDGLAVEPRPGLPR